MKQSISLCLVPIAIAACSSDPATNAQSQSTSGDAAEGDAGADDAASGDSAAGTQYDAALSGAQVVPPVITTSSGTATFVLQPDGMTLTYDVTLSVPGATSVNLHLAPPDENGAVTHPLTPLSSHMTGSVTLTSDEQNDITSDMLYIDVETSANPAGEVRGQLMPSGSQLFVATATPGQELPPVTSSYTGHGSFILSPDQSTVIYHVVTTATPTDVRLQQAVAGLIGPVSDDISPAAQTMDGTLQINSSDPASLEAGQLYLNIVTAANEAGELRGQILEPGESLFSGVLSGGAESPPTGSAASGGAQVILSAAQDSVRYEVDVSGTIPTAIDLDDAPAGQNGPVLATLTLSSATLSSMGALGTTNVTSGEVSTLLAGSGYVNVQTASYPNGELRAQLTPQ